MIHPLAGIFSLQWSFASAPSVGRWEGKSIKKKNGTMSATTAIVRSTIMGHLPRYEYLSMWSIISGWTTGLGKLLQCDGCDGQVISQGGKLKTLCIVRTSMQWWYYRVRQSRTSQGTFSKWPCKRKQYVPSIMKPPLHRMWYWVHLHYNDSTTLQARHSQCLQS